MEIKRGSLNLKQMLHLDSQIRPYYAMESENKENIEGRGRTGDTQAFYQFLFQSPRLFWHCRLYASVPYLKTTETNKHRQNFVQFYKTSSNTQEHNFRKCQSRLTVYVDYCLLA